MQLKVRRKMLWKLFGCGEVRRIFNVPTAAVMQILSRVAHTGPPWLELTHCRYGGQPSLGLPTEAHTYVGKRERRLVGASGFEPLTPAV